MKNYLIACLAVVSAFHVQASEDQTNKLAITGKIYVDGPVAYGPKKYYDRLSKISGATIEANVSLVKVTVVIDDKDNNSNSFESLWTNNGNNCIPNIVEGHEVAYYKQKFGGADLSKKVQYKIKQTFFPDYIPVSVFENTQDREKEHTLKLCIFRYMVHLQCVGNKRRQNTRFQDNLTEQLSNFIKTPLYFKWHKESKSGDSAYMPVRYLIEEKYIKDINTKHLDWSSKDIMNMCLCTRFSNGCPTYCTSDSREYEHGEEGIKNIEKLKQVFSDLFVFRDGYEEAIRENIELPLENLLKEVYKAKELARTAFDLLPAYVTYKDMRNNPTVSKADLKATQDAYFDTQECQDYEYWLEKYHMLAKMAEYYRNKVCDNHRDSLLAGIKASVSIAYRQCDRVKNELQTFVDTIAPAAQ